MDFMVIPALRFLAKSARIGITASALLGCLVQCSSEQVVLSRDTFPSSAAGGSFSVAGSFGAGGGPLPDPSGPCAVHADCAPFNVCQDGQCASCPVVPGDCSGPCPFDFVPYMLQRNGCTVCECVPPSECLSDDNCQAWEICYPGSQCEEDCTDPSCCFGNQCSQPGCSSKWLAVSCVVAGCPGGTSCLSECDRDECDCNGVDWACSGSSDGVTVTSCAWSCTLH